MSIRQKSVSVFTPNKTPTITYIESVFHENEEKLNEALEMGGALINLSGPSKSGKTVFIHKIIGRENLLPITSAGVSCARELDPPDWTVIGRR